MSQERITCKEYCECWNDVDKDCELYGEHHPCPRKCQHFISRHWIYMDEKDVVEALINYKEDNK